MTQKNADIKENPFANFYNHLVSGEKPKNTIEVKKEMSKKQTINTDKLIFGITPNTIFNFDADFNNSKIANQKTIFDASNEKPVRKAGLKLPKNNSNESLLSSSELPSKSGKNFDQIG